MMCWRCCSLWIFWKSINTGIHRILDSFLNRCRAVPHHGWDSHKIPQIKESWANAWVGRKKQIGKEEKEGERLVTMQASAFMSFQCSLSHKGLLAEICCLWFFIEFWIGPIRGICLHKRETFGQGLSKAQTSMSQLTVEVCQRCSLLPNSCNSEPNRCVWGCTKSNIWCLKSLEVIFHFRHFPKVPFSTRNTVILPHFVKDSPGCYLNLV